MKIFKYLIITLIIGCASCAGKEAADSKIANDTAAQRVEKTGPKSVLIISSSPRKDGNSQTLCEQFKTGAEEVGNTVELININDFDIKPFANPDYSRNQEVVEDDALRIVKKMADADVIVLSSPVYFYGMTGQLKCLIDRVFDHENELQNKEFVYIATSADRDETALDETIAGFRGFARCLYGSKELGIVHGNGFEVKDGTEAPAMKEAYKLGKSI